MKALLEYVKTWSPSFNSIHMQGKIIEQMGKNGESVD
jgi:hypothetical protein